MKSISVKRIVVGSIALVVAICTLLSLCFTVISMDLQQGGSIAGQLGAALNDSENGFDLLDGKSELLALMELINLGAAQMQAQGGVTVAYSTYEWLGVLTQVFNIVILLAAILAIAGAILWFFFCRSYKLANSVAIVGLIAGVLYLAEGLVAYFVLQSDIEAAISIVQNQQGSTNVLADTKIFGTAAFVPLILIVLLDIGFLVVSIVLNDRPILQGYAEGGTAQATALEQKPAKRISGSEWKAGASGYAMQAAVKEDIFALLGKLKGALDAGILTQDEFEDQKMLMLFDTKFDYLRNIWSLRRQGVLSEEEYALQKAALFRRITEQAKTMEAALQEAPRTEG